MKKVFDKAAIDKIAQVLNIVPKFKGNNYRFVIINEEAQTHISFEIYPDIPIGKKIGNLISVYTPNSHLQLHFCTGFVVSELLGEVTFIGEWGGQLSGLIIEKVGGCSLYANVDSKLLSGDFTQLGPEVMLSGVALSLAEHILPEAGG
ncbi:hypothetical protein JW935_15800 [candidate division KSB1 bacterium]|nr:hypothetical protein [candidate division KSB1 bacterium]